MGSNIQGIEFFSYLWQGFGLFYILDENKRSLLKSNRSPVSNLMLANLKDDLNIPEYGKPPYKYTLTYYNLYKDIEGFDKSKNPRTTLLKAIIRSVGWDSGFVFIPCSYKRDTKIIGYGDKFWQKISYLMRTHPIERIIIFGRDCLHPLGLNEEKYGIGPGRFQGFRLLVIPSPEDMLPDNREVKNIVWSFLKKL